MKYFLCSIFIFFCSLLSIDGQTAKAFEKAGDEAVLQQDFGTAFQHYATALEIKGTDYRLMYKYADVARRFYAYEIAETYFLKIIAAKKKKEFPLSLYWLALVKKETGDYQKAKTYLQQFLNQNPKPSKEYIELASAEMSNCEWALEQIAVSNAESITITSMGKQVNSPYSEFGAVAKGDSLYYSSFKFNWQSDTHTPKRKITKVLIASGTAKGRPMRYRFNDKDRHTAHTSFSKDGKRIYYTKCDYINSVQIRCGIYYRDWNKKKKRWGVEKDLPKYINLEGFTATQPHIAYDENEQQERLYFVSDRPGGKGKLDIWFTKIQDGEFSKAENMLKFNTIEDDISPYFHSQKGFFFSSKGYRGMGGYDIYNVPISGEQKWSEVKHMGYPINTSYNDLYFSLDQSGTLAYFSSNREGSMYLSKQHKACCNDIYKASFKELDVPKKDTIINQDTIVPVVLIDTIEEEVIVKHIPSQPKIETPIDVEQAKPDPVLYTKLEDFLPLALYFDNDEPDKRTRRETTQKSYTETFEQFYILKEKYMYEFSKTLVNFEKQEAELAIQAFFDNQLKAGFEKLNIFSNMLISDLEKGRAVEIFIKGYTSPRAKGDYNLALSKRRIASLRNHFLRFENGRLREYIVSGQLKITERSFGETVAAKTVSDDLDDERNSIYSVSAALERRVEIIEVGRGINDR